MFARPYVAGDSLEKALEGASRLHRDKGFLTTLDLLAEGVEDGVTARRNIDTYLRKSKGPDVLGACGQLGASARQML